MLHDCITKKRFELSKWKCPISMAHAMLNWAVVKNTVSFHHSKGGELPLAFMKSATVLQVTGESLIMRTQTAERND